MAVKRLLVAGRYRLHVPVGAGGMGRVWMARDEVLDRDVAVKEFIPPDWMTETERDRLRDRTLREARSAARLNHPHVVRIYDVVHADGLPWIVMEYVASRSLYEVIVEDGPLPPRSVARIGLHLLDALRAAHRAGVLHRDVKPHNVLIGHKGRVVLTDFGLATFVDDSTVTGPGAIVGSPQYVAPERARDGASTVEADLWSLGATLYAAVEGRAPYARSSAMATLTALVTEAPDPMALAGHLAPVLAGLLRHEPDHRLRPAQIEHGLRQVLAGGQVTVPSRSRWPGRPYGRLGGWAGVPLPRRSPDREPADATGPTVAGGQATVAGDQTTVAGDQSNAAAPGVPASGLRSSSESEAGHRAADGDETAQPPAVAHPHRADRGRVVGGMLAVLLLGGGGAVIGRLSRGGTEVPPAVAPSAAAPGTGGTSAGGFTASACAGPDRQDRPRTPLPGANRRGPAGRARLPLGWSYHRDTAGFVVAVPDGWTYERVGTMACFREPWGLRVLSIDSARMTVADPVAACRREAGRLRTLGALPGYAEVGIARNRAGAVDWEYRYLGARGNRLHAATRWLTIGATTYVVSWVTAEFDWHGNQANHMLILDSLTPDRAGLR